MIPWYAWLIIGYVVVDRIYHITLIGTSMEITPATAIAAIIVGACHIWVILALAGAA